MAIYYEPAINQLIVLSGTGDLMIGTVPDSAQVVISPVLIPGPIGEPCAPDNNDPTKPGVRLAFTNQQSINNLIACLVKIRDETPACWWRDIAMAVAGQDPDAEVATTVQQLRPDGHVPEICQDPDCGGNCNLCNLMLCSVCGGTESCLPPVCAGRRLTAEELDQVQEQNHRRTVERFNAAQEGRNWTDPVDGIEHCGACDGIASICPCELGRAS